MVGKKFLDLIFRVDTKDASKDVDDLGKGLKGVGTSGKIASGGLKMVGGGIKFIGTAIKAAGIGLLIGVLSQLTGMFQSNQKVADTFGRIMLKLKPIFDVLGDVIGFVAGILEGLIDMFNSAISWIGSLIGVTDNAANSMSNMAGEVVQLRNDVKLMNAELALTQLQYQKEAELQRQLRDDTSKSIDERIAANEELGRILGEQAEAERFMAEEGLRLAEMELRLDRDNIDMQVAVIEAKTKLAEIDERITGQRSEQLTNLNGLEQERATQQKERSDKIKEDLEAERKAYEDIRKEMTKNVQVEKEDLSLKGQLESAAEAYAKAQEHLNNLKSTDTAGNEASIKSSNNLIAQKKKENEQLMEDIERMQAEDDARLEYEDAHQQQVDGVLEIYDKMYAGLSENQQEFLTHSRQREKIANAETLDELDHQTRVIRDYDLELQDALRHQQSKHFERYKDQHLFTEEEVEKDVAHIRKFDNEIRAYYDSIAEQTTHQFDGVIESNQKAIDEAQKLIDENQANIDANNTAIQNKTTEHQLKLDEAEKEFEETQRKLKEQAQAVVNEFRKSEDTKEIDAIKKKYKEIIDLTEQDSTDRKELIEERDNLIKEITERDANELKELIAKNQKELSDLNKSAEDLEIEELNTKYQVMLDMAEELKMSEVEIEKMKQEEINGVKKHYSDLEVEEQKARNQETVDNALSMMNSLLSISKTQADKEIKQLDQKFKKGKITEQQYNRELLRIEQDQLRKEKKAALLQIGVDTASGISSAVKAGAGLTFPANLAAITTGIAAVLAGVAQAAGVLGQSVDGVDDATSDVAGAGGGGDLSGDVPGLPTFGAIGTDAPPIQAFVVETDVSNAQALQSELDLQSTL